MRKLIALSIFGIAFGLLEAIVVFYLQTIVGHGITRQILQDQYSVLLNLKIIVFIALKHPLLKDMHITSVEMWREFSTIIMLISIAYISAETVKQRFGSFLIAFAFWDIFYYIFLHVLIGWPTSLFDIDVLFLIPVVWIAPVITPIVISLIMIVIGIKLYLPKEKSNSI